MKSEISLDGTVRRGRGQLCLLAVSMSALLAGCGGDDSSGGGSDPDLSPGLLSQYYVQDFSRYTSAARQLIDDSARYTLQLARVGRYIMGGQSFTISDNPIRHSGVHYAHAAGLTGAGQIIAITDGGFLTTHDAFEGKSIHTFGSFPVDDHGTAVASVAAGDSDRMVGVAPGADLLLGSFSNMSNRTGIVSLARQLGAVAINNSWTFGDGYQANDTDYRRVFGAARIPWRSSLY